MDSIYNRLRAIRWILATANPSHALRSYLNTSYRFYENQLTSADDRDSDYDDRQDRLETVMAKKQLALTAQELNIVNSTYEAFK